MIIIFVWLFLLQLSVCVRCSTVVSDLLSSKSSIIDSSSVPTLRLLTNSGKSVEQNDFRVNFPSELAASLTHNRLTRHIKLRQKLDLLTEDYREVYYENNTMYFNKSPKNSGQMCFYEGVASEDANSHAAINLCDGKVSGTLFVDGVRYMIDARPLVATVSLTKETDPQLPLSDALIRRKRMAQFPTYYKKMVNWKNLIVELAIVFDTSMYAKYDHDKNKLYQRAKELTNYFNSFYQPLRINIALVGVEVWTDRDNIVVISDGDRVLSTFLQYRHQRLLSYMPNDHAQFLTNVPFINGIVGKANMGSICSAESSGAVVLDYHRDASPVASTMAHELGHNFGMEHDSASCECPHTRCIMANSSSINDMYWSSCSLESLSHSIERGSATCLGNTPEKFFDNSPVCGNGFVEEGEQCDCGLKDFCNNPCCNATTCQFAAKAVCAAGECCDLSICQMKSAASTCREATNDCDLPEFCDGKSAGCPVDIFKQNGLSCNYDQAYCYNGNCNSHTDQCQKIWGSTGQVSSSDCYNLNSRGDKVGSCSWNSVTNVFQPCNGADLMCGMLQCTHETEQPHFGDRASSILITTILTFGNRKVACNSARIDIGSDDVDPGYVPDGAKCGENKMCIKRKCVSVSSVLAKLDCPKNCSNHGVCNSRGNCHCDPGYGGVDCSTSGSGGSADSGPTPAGDLSKLYLIIGLSFFVILLLSLALATVAVRVKNGKLRIPRFLCHWLKSKKPQFPTSITTKSPFSTSDKPVLVTTEKSNQSGVGEQNPVAPLQRPNRPPSQILDQFYTVIAKYTDKKGQNNQTAPQRSAPPPPPVKSTPLSGVDVTGNIVDRLNRSKLSEYTPTVNLQPEKLTVLNGSNDRSPPVISDPIDPKICGKPTDQAPQLITVARPPVVNIRSERSPIAKLPTLSDSELSESSGKMPELPVKSPMVPAIHEAVPVSKVPVLPTKPLPIPEKKTSTSEPTNKPKLIPETKPILPVKAVKPALPETKPEKFPQEQKPEKPLLPSVHRLKKPETAASATETIQSPILEQKLKNIVSEKKSEKQPILPAKPLPVPQKPAVLPPIHSNKPSAVPEQIDTPKSIDDSKSDQYYDVLSFANSTDSNSSAAAGQTTKTAKKAAIIPNANKPNIDRKVVNANQAADDKKAQQQTLVSALAARFEANNQSSD